MKLSREWLSEFVDLEHVSDKEYVDKMTLSGSKVEVADDLRSKIKNIVIGKVTDLKRHEDSDHLWVTTIDISAAEPLQIITGAQNLKVGDVVPVALHNSYLPGGTKITKGKIRGVKSEGMLCGLEELELDTRDFPYAIMDGILVLSDEPGESFTLGADAHEVLGYDDSVIEFEITNNRPDCLSVRGLARESAVTFDVPLKLAEPKVSAGVDNIDNWLKVEIADKDLCNRYSARVVKNIKIAPSPRWLRRRLRASGIRPINNIVDITNYVMLEYGQPMHAFDYACVSDAKIIVRRAKDGEVMNTLDGNLRKLKSDMLMITDPTKIIGIAGVMGGENSEITETTEAIVLESACFNGTSVRRTALGLGMRTDASGRFEKGLDIEGTIPAVQRACELIELLGAGEVISGIVDEFGDAERKGATIELEPQNINAHLGAEIPTEYMLKTLAALGFEIDGEKVTAPTWRSDIEHWTDLSEEVARFYGYDVIEEAPLKGWNGVRGLTDIQKFRAKIGENARAVGFNEILTYSMTPQGGLKILNPLGEDKSRMRISLLPSLLEVLARNRDYGNVSVKLYEVARIYLDQGGKNLPEEREILVLGVADSSFAEFKGTVEELLTALRVSEWRWVQAEREEYHPGICAELSINGEVVGVMGQIHPKTAENTFAAELDVAKLFAARLGDPQYKPLPRFPAVLRDLSVIVDSSVTIDALLDTAKAAGGKLLEKVEFFDLYTGANLPEGKKSVAFSLIFRDTERSLTDEEVNPQIEKVIAAIGEKLGAELRK